MSDDNVVNFPGRKEEVVETKNKEIFGEHTHVYNIIDIRWFTNNRIKAKVEEPIGVVLVEDHYTKNVYAVIGNGKDPQDIAAWGTQIDRKMAEGIFDYEMPDYKVR